MSGAAGWQPTTESEIAEAIRLGDLKENRLQHSAHLSRRRTEVGRVG